MSTPMDLWQLTGDVSSVMSSSCDSAARREKLMGEWEKTVGRGEKGVRGGTFWEGQIGRNRRK